MRVIIFFLLILFRWNACWSARGDAFLFRHARRPCCSCPLKEALYSEEVLLEFKSLAPKISRAPQMWVHSNDTSWPRTRIIKAPAKYLCQYCNLCSYDCRDVKTKAITSKQWHLWTAIKSSKQTLLKAGKCNRPERDELRANFANCGKNLACNCLYWLSIMTHLIA